MHFSCGGLVSVWRFSIFTLVKKEVLPSAVVTL
jgi:hypothetical protein